MNQLKVEPGKDPLNYSGAYKAIANAMKAHGVTELGDPNYRQKCGDKFKDKDGEIRTASLDMDIDGRIERTVSVRALTNDQLENLHTRELFLGYFLVGGQIKAFCKAANKLTLLSEERKKYIQNFNDENRPEMRQEFGITVPPYFPPDNEFDGMEYHHAWDKSVRINFWDLPAIAVKKRGSKFLDEDAE